MTAKITVITAVLDRAEDLRRTIDSVLGQAYPNLDVIIIDGGSNDDCLDVIRQHADRLTKWVSEPDRGVYDAMNKGWALADPESYILFLGAGDRLISLPESLPRPGDRPRVFYGTVRLDNDKEFVSYANWRLRLYNALHHQGLLVPKVLHPEPPFNTDFRLYADFDFNQRLMKRPAEFIYLDGFVAAASPPGLTATTAEQEISRIARKNFGLFWGAASLCGFRLVRLLPFLRRLRPIR